MLRRERVFERDIFRLGTGTVLTPLNQVHQLLELSPIERKLKN